MAKENKIRICINGNGGEFVLGEITKDVYQYWSIEKPDYLEDYALNSGLYNGYIEENNIPKNMDFLESGWYECDNVEHMDFCILDEYAKCIIEFPDGKKHEIKEIRYWDYDENFREVKEVYTGEGSGCYPKGYYFSCEANEKGTLFVFEIVLPLDVNFDEKKLVLFYVDFNGYNYLINLGYILPGDNADSPTMLQNVGGSTSGRSLTFDLFEVTD